jgi:uncharacterized membrane protein (Fun14 family)
LPVEDFLFSAGGGLLLGYLAGKAVKVVAKITAIIIGLFILGLAYLAIADEIQNFKEYGVP